MNFSDTKSALKCSKNNLCNVFNPDLHCALFFLLSLLKTNSTPHREAQRRSGLKEIQRLQNKHNFSIKNPKIPKNLLLRMHLNSLNNQIMAMCLRKRLLLEASSQMSVKYQKGLQFRINSNSIKSNKSLFWRTEFAELP